MSDESVQALLKELGVDPYKSYRSGDHIQVCCPLAPWTHPKGRDSRPSMGIWLQGGKVTAHCFSCQHRSSIAGLAWRYSSLSGVVLDPFLIDAASSAPRTLPNARVLKRQERRTRQEHQAAGPQEVAGIWFTPDALYGVDLSKVQEYPETLLDPFCEMADDGYAYLTSGKRGLIPAAISTWELGWDYATGRIVIPIRDCKGRLVGYSRKDPYPNSSFPWWHSKDFQKKFYLYGEHKIEPKNRSAILVEGFFDVIYLWQCGYVNVLAVMGTTLNEPQKEKLCRYFDHVTIALDADKAGELGADKIEAMLAYRVATKRLRLPEGLDPDQLRDRVEREKLFGPPQRACLTPDRTHSINDTLKGDNPDSGAVRNGVGDVERPEGLITESEFTMTWTPSEGKRPTPKTYTGGPHKNFKPGDIPLWIWERDPFQFKIPVAADNETPEVRDIIFIDRACAGVYQHQGTLLKQKLNGESFKRFSALLTCQSEAGIPEGDRVCCKESGKKPNNEKAMDELKNKSWYGYYTATCLQPMVIGDKVYTLEPVFLAATPKSDILLEDARKDAGDRFEGHRWVAKRFADKQSPTIGSKFVIGKPVAMDKLFTKMTWAGFPLSALWDVAEAHPEHMEGLMNLFNVKKNEDGSLVRMPPAFNYAHLLRPLPGEEIEQILGLKPFPSKNPSKPASARPATKVSTTDFDLDIDEPGADKDTVPTERATVSPTEAAAALEEEDDIPF